METMAGGHLMSKGRNGGETLTPVIMLGTKEPRLL
jgi:hypothetical protein